MRNHLEIQRFVSSRILNNATGAEAVDRGVDLVVQEMRPFLQNFVCFNKMCIILFFLLDDYCTGTDAGTR